MTRARVSVRKKIGLLLTLIKNADGTAMGYNARNDEIRDNVTR